MWCPGIQKRKYLRKAWTAVKSSIMKTQPLDLLMTWGRKKKASQGEKEPLSGVGLRKKMKGVFGDDQYKQLC